jgi:hypothetical protein
MCATLIHELILPIGLGEGMTDAAQLKSLVPSEWRLVNLKPFNL